MFDYLHNEQTELDRLKRHFHTLIDSVLRGVPPEPKRCASPSELAFWFSQFANACRRALPSKKEAEQ